MQDKYKTLLVISGLAVAVLVIFWRVSEFGFVFDDEGYVSKNEHVSTGLTVKNIIWVFTSEHGGNWHPLTGLSHLLDCQLFDLKAGRHHLVNLLFHIANTLLLFSVLRRETRAFWQSAFVAAVFGLHSAHVESVAWIAERKDVLSTLFFLLTIASYFRYIKTAGMGWYLFTLLLFVIGLMAKPMLVTLPFVLLLLDYWPLNRLDVENRNGVYHLVLEKIPFFILSAVSSVVTFLVQKSTGAVAGGEILPFTGRIANAGLSYFRYIEKMVWPVNLAVFYPYRGNIPSLRQDFAAGALLLIITIVVIRLGGKYKYLPTGWFWYVGTLVPVIGLVQAGEQSMADRYTYIPFTGLFIAVAWGANDLLAKWKYRQMILWSVSLPVILLLAVLAWFQVGCWYDNKSLFEHAVRVTNGNYLAYNNLGLAYYNEGKIDEAISDYDKAIEINPRYALAYYNRGNAYARSNGWYDRAIADYDKVIEINPRFAMAYNNRGNVLCIKGRIDQAISDYNKAIEINPRLFDAYFNKAYALEQAGRKAEAIEVYKIFIQFTPAAYTSFTERARQKIKELER